MIRRLPIPLLLLPAVTFVACADHGEDVGRADSALVAQCAADLDALPDHVWTCPDDLTVECSSPNGTPVTAIYVAPPASQTTCATVPALDVEPGPFPLGETEVVVTAGRSELCAATLTVEDTMPPAVTPHTVELWPPNHELHAIGVDDCVTVSDACDGDVHLRFTHVSSDEATDDLGDGNTEPDVEILGCDQVRLRAERRGDGNGRVYALGFIATDASGNTTEGTCRVEVPHDQGANGEAVADPSVTATTIAACAP